MRNSCKKLITCLLATLIISPALQADDQDRRQAKRIHDRLTGVPATNADIDAMEALLISDSSGKSAADYAITSASGAASFYNVTVKNYAAPWTNEEADVFVPFNDYTATIVGMVRDGEDFRQVLHGDIIYTDSTPSNYSNSSNTYYENMESQDLSLILQKQTQSSVTGLPANATAGVMTTRAGAKSFFSDGTNRAMFRFTLINHLCTDLEPLKDVSRTPDRVRQDVSRSPGGDSRIYLNNCVGCHAGMDGMAGAYAFYEYNYTDDKETGSLGYTPSNVSAKHLINENNFNPGYITTDDSWINYWRNGQNSIVGWNGGYAGEVLDAKGNATGNGAKSLGLELANTTAFAQCQVDKAYKAICLRDPNDYAADRTVRDTIVSNFRGAYNYDMREVFTDVAAECKGS